MVRVFGKISSASMKARVLGATLAQCGKVVAPMALVLMCAAYIYAIIGMEFLQGRLDSDHSTHWVNCSPNCPSFDSIGSAVLTLLHLLVGANWSPILDEAKTNTGTFLGPVIFFMSFVLLSNVFMLSLLAALVLEVYAHEMDRTTRLAAEEKLAMVLSADEDIDVTDKLGSAQIMLSAAVRKKFDGFDVDQSGALALEELRDLLVVLGAKPMTDNEAKDAFRKLDHDGSGLIEFDEFLPWWRDRGLRHVFEAYDADHSGTIDSAELHNVLLELGLDLSPEEEQDALRRMDSSGDGKIGYTEYVAWFERLDMQIEFNKIDHDKSGSVNKREFLKLTTVLGLQLTRRERDNVFASLDLDRSGVISFEEFHPWFKEVRENMKQFVLGKLQWEEDLFLSPVDRAQREAQEMIQHTVSEIGEELEEGKVFTRADLLKRLCGSSTKLIMEEALSPARRHSIGPSAEDAVVTIAPAQAALPVRVDTAG